MSSGFWQTKRQTLPSPGGKTITRRIETYTRTWEARCYNDGIPDELPRKLEASSRVPSWRAVAIAVLKNDHNLHSLGFRSDQTQLERELKQARQKKDNPQQELFK